MNPSVQETIGRYFPSILNTPRTDSQRTVNALGDLSASAQTALQANPRYATYHRHLSLVGHGTPLWLPEPNEARHINYRRRGVAIGDVIFFTANGGVDFLFNICLDAHDPINGGDVPEGYSPFRPALAANDIRRFQDYGEDSYLASKSITKQRDRMGPAGLVFQSSAAEGAILTMPEGAYSEDLARVSGFDRYLADNLDSWYEYVNDVREWGVQQGELHLVTGVHKAKAWGMATFSNETTTAMDLRMRFKSDGDLSSGILYSWEYEGIVDSTRTGPTRRQRDAIFEGLSEVERQPLENQCLFVRTVNGMVRKPKKLKDRESSYGVIPLSQGSANPGMENPIFGRRNEISSSQGGTNETRGTSVLEQLGAQDDLSIVRNGPVLRDHPSKAINNFLLKEKPNGRIAITHDQDWISLLTNEDVSLPSGDELVVRLKKSYQIIDDEGVISVEYKDSHSDITTKGLEHLHADEPLVQDDSFSRQLRGITAVDYAGLISDLERMNLHEASERGYEAVVKALLEKGANVNAHGGEYGNALQAASAQGHEAVANLLLDNGADVNAQGGLYGNALQAASVKGYDAVAVLLLKKGAHVNAEGEFYGPALLAASTQGHEAVVKVLLENGADINSDRGVYGTALQRASREGHEVVVKLLLEKGATANELESEYGNVLQMASAKGYEAIAKLLLEKGADINAQGGIYGTALQAASTRGHEAVVKLLLENGANVNVLEPQHTTALQVPSAQDDEAMLKLLLESGANVNPMKKLSASARRYKEAAKLPPKKRADTNASAQDGPYDNASRVASRSGYKRITNRLQEDDRAESSSS